MRVMILVKATGESETGVKDDKFSTEMMEAMGKFNRQLEEAGVILMRGEGLKPSSAGKRILFDGPKRSVTDGPFAETKEIVAGFWIWKVKDMDEAVEWVKKCPNPMPTPSEIEIRPLYEMEDFADLVSS